MFIDTTSTIDSRLTAIASVPCMTTTTLNPNTILHQPPELVQRTCNVAVNPYENSKLATILGCGTQNDTITTTNIGHTDNGSNCHQSINQTKISALTMSQLSTVYATKRRRRNGKR